MKKIGSEIRDKHPGSATLKERHSLMLIFNLLIHLYVKDCLLYHSQNAFFFRCQHWFVSGRKEWCWRMRSILQIANLQKCDKSRSSENWQINRSLLTWNFVTSELCRCSATILVVYRIISLQCFSIEIGTSCLKLSINMAGALFGCEQ
jgi:hypothetical protein